MSDRTSHGMDVAQSFAATFVDELAAQGVEFACVSPGSRSAPIAMALQRHPRIKVLIHIDERCGSFFAVGLGKATGKPAVVLSTSGTAAAELDRKSTRLNSSHLGIS